MSVGARVRRGLSWSPHLAVPTAVRSEETSTFPSLLVSEAGRRVWPITRTVSAVPAGHRQAARGCGCGCGCGCGRSKGGMSSCRSKAAAQGAGRRAAFAPAWRRPFSGLCAGRAAPGRGRGAGMAAPPLRQLCPGARVSLLLWGCPRVAEALPLAECWLVLTVSVPTGPRGLGSQESSRAPGGVALPCAPGGPRLAPVPTRVQLWVLHVPGRVDVTRRRGPARGGIWFCR